MIRILQWLFVGHVHKWRTLEKHNITREGDGKPIGVALIQECEHCGTVRRKDLK